MASVTGTFNAATIQTSGSFALDTGTLSNMLAQDGTAQSFVLGISPISAGASDTVKVTGWTGSVPSGATIDGIEVTVYKYKTGSGTVNDNLVKLCRAGSAVGSNKASATDYPGSVLAVTYGGPSDLWGASWSQSHFDNTFGVHIAGNCGDYAPPYAVGTYPDLPYWDHVAATVYYTESTSSGSGASLKQYCFDGGGEFSETVAGAQAESNIPRPYLGVPTEAYMPGGPYSEWRLEDE